MRQRLVRFFLLLTIALLIAACGNRQGGQGGVPVSEGGVGAATAVTEEGNQP
jgi:outer membrane lipopolysaccharide assembly protein LptE/RlpB